MDAQHEKTINISPKFYFGEQLERYVMWMIVILWYTL